MLDFFLEQTNIFPGRGNNIFDFVFMKSSETILNMSCEKPRAIGLGLFGDNALLFFYLNIYVRTVGCDNLNVFDFSRADWNALNSLCFFYFFNTIFVLFKLIESKRMLQNK